MKKLCVLFTTSHSDTLGNAGRLEMVNYLSQNFDTTILTNRKAFIQERFPHCAVIGYESQKNRYLPVIADILESRKIAKCVKQIQSEFVFMIVDTAPVALWLKQPVFQYVHQYGQRSEYRSGFCRKKVRNIIGRINHAFIFKGLKKSKATFVVSRPIIEILKNKGLQHLVHTPHGVELEKFRNPFVTDMHEPLRKLRAQGCFLVTYTGWVTENRGFQLMLDSIRQAVGQDEKIVLVIAGADNHYSQRITAYAQKHDLSQNILDLGVIDAKLIPGILHYSDVCLSFLDDVPAYRISPPQKVVEYFAAGKPVLCNKIASHEWLVDHGKNGYILAPNPVDVGKAIWRLKNDKNLYDVMADNAFQAAKKYDIDLIYGNMVNVIEKCLDEA